MNLQLIIALIVLAGALFFIGKRMYKSMAGKGEHGSCADCNTIEDMKQKKVSG